MVGLTSGFVDGNWRARMDNRIDYPIIQKFL